MTLNIMDFSNTVTRVKETSTGMNNRVVEP